MSTGQINLLDEIIVDNFAGGGGASTGMELATAGWWTLPSTMTLTQSSCTALTTPTPPTTRPSVWDVDPVRSAGGAGGAGLVFP